MTDLFLNRDNQQQHTLSLSLEFTKYLSHWDPPDKLYLNDDMLPYHHTAIYMFWNTGINS